MGVETFSRYTNFAAAIHMLRTSTITLFNPAAWDDTNDAHFMAEYKRYRNARAVLALCFTESDEKYHHWRVFSHGRDGVRIEFDKLKLMEGWNNDPAIRFGQMDYIKVDNLRRETPLEIERLPFVKRLPYGDEREFRVIFVEMNEPIQHKSYSIDISCIRRITLSP
jgi:hypothetical protein